MMLSLRFYLTCQQLMEVNQPASQLASQFKQSASQPASQSVSQLVVDQQGSQLISRPGGAVDKIAWYGVGVPTHTKDPRLRLPCTRNRFSNITVVLVVV